MNLEEIELKARPIDVVRALLEVYEEAEETGSIDLDALDNVYRMALEVENKE